jgi:hypothetical protein
MPRIPAFRRGLRRARNHGAWPKLDEREKLKLIVECVKEEMLNLPMKRTLCEFLTGQ